MKSLQTIMMFLGKMCLPMLLGAALCLLSGVVRAPRLKRRRMISPLRRELCLALLVGFLCGLFALIVLPTGLPAGGGINYNLVPLRILGDIAGELRVGKWTGFWISLVGNVIFFLPIGLLPALLWRGIDLKKALLIGFAISLTIELCQLPLGRCSDVDDLLLNTAGTAGGFGLYRLLTALSPGFASRYQVKPTTERTYIL